MRTEALPGIADGGPVARSFGPYVLLGRIASGGFGQVLLAKHRGIERLVAIKLLHEHLLAADGDVVDMFRDEARLSTYLAHPNIVPVIDTGTVDGVPYIAMDYVRGETGARVLRAFGERGSTISQSAWWGFVGRVLCDVATGLDAAHRATDLAGRPLDVIHRDVCPSNLFVGYCGVTRIADFGIAKAEGRATRTTTGIFKGHVAYAAPEYLSEGTCTVAADVWSVGVVGWELLHARSLFKRSSEMATFKAITIDDLPPIDAAVPRDLARIVRRCLCRTPEARWSSAAELAEALDEWLSSAAVPGSHLAVARVMQRLIPDGEHAHSQRLRTASALLGTKSGEVEAAGADLVETRTLVRESRPAAPKPARVRVARVALAAVLVAALSVLSGVVGASLLGSATAAPVGRGDPPAPRPTPARPVSSAPVVALPIATSIDSPAPAEESTSRSTVSPSRPRATRAESSARTGRLAVSVAGGWGRVSVDGQTRCETPCQLELPARAHRLTVELPEGRVRTRRVVVRAGATLRIVETP